MEEKAETKKQNYKKKNFLRYSKSLIFPYNNKIQLKAFKSSLNNNNNFEYSKENSLNNLSEKKRNHLLIIQKLNIKDKKNSFYKKGVNDIFNDENLYLSDKYKNNKVVVGRKINPQSNFITNLYSKKNLINFNKKRFPKSTTTKNISFLRNRKDEISNILRKIKSIDKNNLKAYDFPQNNSIESMSSRYGNIRKSFNMYGKRSSIFYPGDNNISDGELKILYKKFLEIEKENKIKKIKLIKINDNDRYVNDRNENNTQIKDKKYKKLFKTSIDKEINAKLNLQEKILNKFKIVNKENQKLMQKIIKNTSKDNNDILLMNQLDSFRMKIEKIDEEQNIKKDNYNKKNIYWVSNLRNYPTKKLKGNEKENNILSNANNFPYTNKNIRKIIQSKDDICNNYLNNIQYSFGNNSNLYCDIESNISPLYPLILPDSLKRNEKIRNTHIDDSHNINNNSLNTKYSFNIKKLKNNYSVPSLSDRLNINEKNKNQALKDLNIEGKRLIDFEIEISKNLEGKRKNLIKTKYNDDETDTKILAKSYLLDNYNFPKAVNNAFQIHILKEN